MTNATLAEDSVVLFGGASVKGREHAENEDTLWLPFSIAPELLARKGYLFILADGVGGYQGGKLASQTAVEALQRSYYGDTTADVEMALRQAVEDANVTVYEQAHATGYTDMASTVVAAVIQQQRLVVANVGDSRAYVWRRGKKLRQLSTDHTWVAERLAEGLLTEEEAAHHQLRHVITRSLGHEPAVEPAMRTVTLQPEDRLLLCCDGIWEVVPEEALTHNMSRNASPQRIAQRLSTEALNAGGPDDASAIVTTTCSEGGANPLHSFAAAVVAIQTSSPVLFLVGSIAVGLLLLALLGLMVTSAWRSLQAQLPPAPSPSFTATAAWIITPTSAPLIKTDAPTALPVTVTPVPEPTATATLEATPTPKPPTSTPMPVPTVTAFQHCILPSANTNALNAPANNVNPQTCLGEGLSVPVGMDIEVLPYEVSWQAACGQPVIRAIYQETGYLLFPYRIGIRTADGACASFDWQSYFSQARTE